MQLSLLTTRWDLAVTKFSQSGSFAFLFSKRHPCFYQSGTLHRNRGGQLYRSGGPGLGFGHRGPLGQGAPVDSVPHKPVSLVWGHTAAMLHKHLLCIIYFKGLLCVMVKS